jgi:hypothetical protein
MPERIQPAPPALPTALAEDGAEAVKGRAAPSISVVIATPPLSELALGCLGQVDAVILPFAALSPNPFVAALVGIKAGSELRECIDQRTAEASLRAGIEECLANGGTPLGVIENVVTCQLGAP